MRFLALDLGAKRTGLAVGDDATHIVTPLAVIVTAHPGERLRLIGRAIDEHGPEALVVGWPLVGRDPGAPGPRRGAKKGVGGNPIPKRGDSPTDAGVEGPAARQVRAFADELSRRFGLRVFLADERLSSYAADQQMSQSGLTRQGKKERRDALAAAVILRDFLEARETKGP